jgi:hypothetical protein
MGVGRFFCVALPFILTVGSLIFLLVATLGGVANTNLFLFRVNTTDLSINPASIGNLLNSRADLSASLVEARGEFKWHDRRLLGKTGSGNSQSQTQSNNITAADLGLGNLYDVSLWGYCVTGQDGARVCTKPTFNWAASALNTTFLENFGSAATGKKIDLPDEITTALTAFTTVAKWTEITFIVALICLGVELFFGIFATCSRAWACVTFIVASITSAAVIGAASLSTAMAVVVVGSVEGTARWYGVNSAFNTTFLSLVWLSAALALGAGFFWMFTVCCCAPSHGSRKSKARSGDAEKLLPTGAYQPLHEPEHTGYYGQNNAPQYGAPRYPSGAPRSDIAYEPYSHRP